MKQLLPIIYLCMALLLGATFISCSSNQEISLKGNGSGSAAITIQMNQVLIDYLQDFSIGLGYGNFQDDIFDSATIAETLAAQGMELTRYQRIDDLLWEMDIEFDYLQLKPLVTLTQYKGLYTLRFTYSYEIFQEFKDSFGPDAAEFFELLGPGPDYVSREEYIEFLLFAFEAYIDNPNTFRLFLEEQKLKITLNLEGELVSVTGGRVLPSGAVEFAIPMVDFASGDLELNYSLQWQDN